MREQLEKRVNLSKCLKPFGCMHPARLYATRHVNVKGISSSL